jgi:hypothetical protein
MPNARSVSLVVVEVTEQKLAKATEFLRYVYSSKFVQVILT